MALRKYFRDDFRYLIFSEFYQSLDHRKTGRTSFQILEASIKCLANFGYPNISMKKIERESGVSSSKICYYFKNLNYLKICTVKYSRLLYQAYVVEKVSGANSLEQAVTLYLAACFDWPEKFPVHRAIWVSFLHQACVSVEFRKINTQAVEVGLLRFKSIVEKYNGAGFLEENSNKIVGLHIRLTGQLLAEATEDLSKENTLYRRDQLLKLFLMELSCN